MNADTLLSRIARAKARTLRQLERSGDDAVENASCQMELRNLAQMERNVKTYKRRGDFIRLTAVARRIESL